MTDLQLKIITEEIVKFNLMTDNYYADDDSLFEEVEFAYNNPGYIFNDWDEGENNDPYWNKEKNMNSVIFFIEETIKKIKK